SYLIAWGCWAAALWGATGQNWVNVIYLAPVGLHFVWQLIVWQPTNPASSLSVFKSNRWIGWLTLFGIAASIAPT
ncbi:MAG: 4-hydroxybenzoate octaprenyltransferase, partial [Pseudomonadota bacterium]